MKDKDREVMDLEENRMRTHPRIGSTVQNDEVSMANVVGKKISRRNGIAMIDVDSMMMSDKIIQKQAMKMVTRGPRSRKTKKSLSQKRRQKTRSRLLRQPLRRFGETTDYIGNGNQCFGKEYNCKEHDRYGMFVDTSIVEVIATIRY